MTTWVVTRHSGALDWLAARGVVADRVVAHLDAGDLGPGDTVIGVLPFPLAAAVCAGGGRFFRLDVAVPAGMRGVDLSAAQLTALGARLTEYRVCAQGGGMGGGVSADNLGFRREDET